MGTHEPAVLRRLLDLALELGGVRGTEAVLRTILDAARELTGARYAAIGVPDGDGGFALFLTAGVDQATWDRIGALPRSHGLLGAMLADPDPIRLADIRADPRFRWWPAAHPVMRAFLGVPIVAGGDVVAALYLTDPPGDREFTDADQEVVEALAAHAALAVVNAQRTERTRELSIAEERTRLAHDLHDSVTQTLFSLTLAAETAAALPAGDPGGAAELDRVRLLAATAQDELRALVDTLRPVDLVQQGLAAALRRRIDLLRRVHDVDITLTAPRASGVRRPAVDAELFKVASEALSNALQHSGAGHVRVAVDSSAGGLRLTVSDDGRGFAPSRAGPGHLGLVSMRERMDALGGVLHVQSARGKGTTVLAEVPDA
ncbi:MAG: GAF domain-containing sensor histidine kinase [Geodermatophilaceae bacterium]|nr:GAF domain-containing sensor histidine kinase [Geodermatophilaceae bacterium]MDQ3455672.1 GAF domain-containing sensor histidine kinase [Actinomycetota bacterium]